MIIFDIKYLKRKILGLICALTLLCLFGCASGTVSENTSVYESAPQETKAVQSPELPASFFISDISADADTNEVVLGVALIDGDMATITASINGETIDPQDVENQTWYFLLPIESGTVVALTLEAIGADGAIEQKEFSMLLVDKQGVISIEKETAAQVTFLMVDGGLDDFSALDDFIRLSALGLVAAEYVALPDDFDAPNLEYLYVDGYAGTFTAGEALRHMKFITIKTDAGTIAGDFSWLTELEQVALQGTVEAQALSSIGYCERLRFFEIHDENASIPEEVYSNWRSLRHLIIDGANTGISIYDLRQLPELSFLSLNNTDISGGVEDLLLLTNLETLVLQDISVSGDIDVLCGLPGLSEATFENCAGLDGDGEQLQSQLNGNLVYQTGKASVAAESVIGRYSGSYKNNSGMMNMVIEIVSIDAQNRAAVNFEFEPVSGNTQGKSGKYRLTGSFDPETGEIILTPDRWISSQPAGYEMLAIEGTVDGDQFKGKLDREYLPYFTAEKQ